MIIDIEESLFYKLVELMKNRNTAIHKQLKDIKPITIASNDGLKKARKVKTARIKEVIKTSIEEIISKNINVSKYQVHKKTNVSYPTLNKYYDDILNEILKNKKVVK